MDGTREIGESEPRRLGSILLLVSIACAVLPAGWEAAAFVHDRIVVHQDFACLERRLAAEARSVEDVAPGGTYPACNIVSRKVFGMRSTRAWSNGLPRLLFSMDERQVRTQLLTGVPFLLVSSWSAFRRRRTTRLVRWGLLVASWVLLLVALAAIQWPPDLERLRAEEPGRLESTVMTYWWTVRTTSMAWLVATVVLAAVHWRSRARQRA